MRVGWFLLVAACSYAPQRLADDAAPGDTSTVTDTNDPDVPTGPTCMDQWRNGTVVVTTPTLVSAASSPQSDRDPYLSRDGLTLYFGSNRATSSNTDVWVTQRAARDLPFGDPSIRLDLQSGGGDSKISLTEDELTVFIASDRGGGQGSADIWMGTRLSIAAPFGSFEQTKLTAVNDANPQLDPHVSLDGLRLYFAPPGGPTQHLELATRPDVGAAFGAPILVDSVNSGTVEGDPSLSDDERVIVFASDRPGKLGTGRCDLWYARRPSPNDPFGTAIHLPDISSTFQDGDASLSSDGCELFFASDRSGDFEVYRTTVVLP